ncbi:TSUP family transporter [Paracoccus beibuensis]|uniref:TSUP family transporter n=1 Tax=Paracoccus beibuensis TaxID=547602 RepID=UPI00223FED5E|nr:TSUP family transporter [Paracoccus beibuensis]
MTPLLMLAFAATVLTTSFVSGLFGMAGGMLLMGVLLFLVSVPDAMVLHGVAQMASNGWRALLWRKYILWRVVARYIIGLIAAGMLFVSLVIVPDERVVLLLLGVVPFVGRMLPDKIMPQATQPGGAEWCGFISTSLQLLSGVSGPLLDMFFVRSVLDRRVVVATKAACQVVTHLSKLLYFGLLLGGGTASTVDPLVLTFAVAMAVLGTSMSRMFLERMTDQNFRKYTWRIVMAVGCVYLVKGLNGYLPA